MSSLHGKVRVMKEENSRFSHHDISSLQCSYCVVLLMVKKCVATKKLASPC